MNTLTLQELSAPTALLRYLFPEIEESEFRMPRELVERCPLVTLNEECAWAEVLRNRPMTAWLCRVGIPPTAWRPTLLTEWVALRTRATLLVARLAAPTRPCMESTPGIDSSAGDGSSSGSDALDPYCAVVAEGSYEYVDASSAGVGDASVYAAGMNG